MNKITKFTDKCIIVNIPIGAYNRANLYEATRRCWRVNLIRAKKADYVIGVVDGEVKCVIKISNCDYVQKTEFCNKEKEACKSEYGVNIKLCEKRRRIAFEGKEIKNDKIYLHKFIPNEYLPNKNPVRYTY